MTGPAKQFDRTIVLKKALQLFWSKGFEATSMQDLVEAMQINRASMYDTFGNKKQLYHEAIDQYCRLGLQRLAESLQAQPSPLANIRRLLDHGLGTTDPGMQLGCFIGNSAVELGPHDTEVAQKIRHFWADFEAQIDQTLKRAVTAGELSQDIDTRSLATLINTILQGIAVRTKVGIGNKQLKELTHLTFDLITRK